MPETKAAPIVLGIGAIGLAGLGAYFLLKKPPGVSPGDTITAKLKFDYLDEGGSYVLLVRFGYYKPPYFPLGFDEEENMGHHTLNISLTEPDTYEYDIDIVIPDGARIGTYDVEGSILSPEMAPGRDWILRAYQKSAIAVRE